MFNQRHFIFTTAWKFAKFYEKALNGLGRELKLTQCEMDVILFLYSDKQMNTSRNISDYRSISKSLICKSVASLSAKKLLVSECDNIDARVMRLTLTDEGEAIGEKLSKAIDELCNVLCAGVTSSEMQVLSSVYTRMMNNTQIKYK